MSFNFVEPPGLFQPHNPALFPETPTGRTHPSQFLIPSAHKKSPSFDELLFVEMMRIKVKLLIQYCFFWKGSIFS